MYVYFIIICHSIIKSKQQITVGGFWNVVPCIWKSNLGNYGFNYLQIVNAREDLLHQRQHDCFISLLKICVTFKPTALDPLGQIYSRFFNK